MSSENYFTSNIKGKHPCSSLPLTHDELGCPRRSTYKVRTANNFSTIEKFNVFAPFCFHCGNSLWTCQIGGLKVFFPLPRRESNGNLLSRSCTISIRAS